MCVYSGRPIGITVEVFGVVSLGRGYTYTCSSTARFSRSRYLASRLLRSSLRTYISPVLAAAVAAGRCAPRAHGESERIPWPPGPRPTNTHIHVETSGDRYRDLKASDKDQNTSLLLIASWQSHRGVASVCASGSFFLLVLSTSRVSTAFLGICPRMCSNKRLEIARGVCCRPFRTHTHTRVFIPRVQDCARG